MGDLAEARNSLKRAQHLLSVAYLATNGVDDDPCRGMAEHFGAIIDAVEDGIEDAMMLVWSCMSADERKAELAERKAKPDKVAAIHGKGAE